MAGWTVVLDPVEVADTGRAQLDLNTGPIQVEQTGIDWGDATITAYMAEQVVGSSPIDYRTPNRTVVIPLALGMDSSNTFDLASQQLRQKVALFQREGGRLKRQRQAGVKMYADIVNASLHFPDVLGDTGRLQPGVVLTLECLPDFYGDEIALDTIYGANGEVASTLKIGGSDAIIAGDTPARCRFVITDSSGNDQRGLLAGVRSMHYDSAPTARLSYEAEVLTRAGGATQTTQAAASGGATIGIVGLTPLWAPVLATDLAGVGPLTHKGSYRVFARMNTGLLWLNSNQDVPASIRLVWAVGDSSFAAVNPLVRMPASNAYYLCDLGQITLDSPPSGIHYWRGTIQARGTSGAQQDVWVDKIWLVPIDENYCQLIAPPSPVEGLNPLSTFDSFATLANGANLNARAPMVGSGSWATSPYSGAGSSGDVVDFTGSVNKQVTRATTNDYTLLGGTLGGRTALLTPSVVETEIGVDFFATAYPNGATAFTPGYHFRPGLLARYITQDLYLFFGRVGPRLTLNVGIGTDIYDIASTPYVDRPNQWISMYLRVTASGHVRGAIGPRNGAWDADLSAYDPALATGGAVAQGQVGLQDMNGMGVASARYWTNFYSRNPSSTDVQTVGGNTVCYANRSVRLGTDGNFRQSAAGTVSVPVTKQIGDMLRLPPSGLEGRPAEVLVKPTQGDFGNVPDSGLDPFTVQPFYRPCYLFRP